MKNSGGGVIITGASRGIGKGMATAFAGAGYPVLINYHTSEKEAAELARSLQARDLTVELFRADVARRGEVDALVDFCVQSFGAVSILINNAGIGQTKLFTELSDEDWDAVMDVNLKGVFNCTQSVLRYMLPAKKGKIINISSIWGLAGASCEVHYSAAKAGVIGFTKALAKELGPSGIQVNCIAPGIVATDMLSAYTPQELQDLKDATPLGKIGTPEDIAACALFLASKEADFITGQVISPNGGFVI